MRIVHCTTRYWPAVGGVEEYVRHLSQAMVARGHEVEVHTSNIGRILEGYRYVPLPRDGADGHEIPIHRHRALTIPGHRYFILPTLPLSLLRSRPTVLHAHSFGHFPADTTALVALSKGIPLVFNPYLTAPLQHSFLGKWYRKTLGRTLERAEVVLALTIAEKNFLESSGFRLRRVEILPPGVDLAEFEEGNPNIYQRLGFTGRPIILFVGRLQAYKGVETLIAAAPHILSHHPQALFFIVGPDGGAKERLVGLAQGLGIREAVIFAGELSRQDLISAYRHASVFVFPSRKEAFGLVLIEALATGLPLVVSQAVAHIITPGETGLVFPTDDHRALAEAVNLLLEDGSLRHRLAQKGRELVRAEFTWERSAQRLEAIYQSLG